MMTKTIKRKKKKEKWKKEDKKDTSRCETVRRQLAFFLSSFFSFHLLTAHTTVPLISAVTGIAISVKVRQNN